VHRSNLIIASLHLKLINLTMGHNTLFLNLFPPLLKERGRGRGKYINMDNNEIASLRSQLVMLTKYNLWANTKVSEFLLKLDPALLDKELISSFKTIRATLYHIWDAELIWFTRLNGTSLAAWPSESFDGPNEEAFDLFTSLSEKFVSFAESCTEEFLQNVIQYTSIEGKNYSNTVYEILTHVMNHSTFHRGQLITMLRNAGYTDLSSTDYITFIRQ